MLLRDHSLCEHCRNIMITFPEILADLCSIENEVLDFKKRYNGLNPRNMLFIRLFDQPQSPKIMMEICRKSIGIFRSMCISLDLLHQAIIHEFEPIGNGWTRAMLQYSEIMCLTVKYWRRDQLKYFLDNHMDMIDVRMDYVRKLLRRQGYTTIETISIPGLADEFHLSDIDYTIDILVWGRRSIVRKEAKRRVVCSSLKCGKTQRDCEDQFKLCAGCKLTYYCCRTCQKKAWKEHKAICVKLRRLYAL